MTVRIQLTDLRLSLFRYCAKTYFFPVHVSTLAITIMTIILHYWFCSCRVQLKSVPDIIQWVLGLLLCRNTQSIRIEENSCQNNPDWLFQIPEKLPKILKTDLPKNWFSKIFFLEISQRSRNPIYIILYISILIRDTGRQAGRSRTASRAGGLYFDRYRCCISPD